MSTSLLSSPGLPSPQPSFAELHLLFTLSDSALPTGGFISSSGLESFAKHGFLASSSTTPTSSPLRPTSAIIEFARAEVEQYASTTSLFVLSSFTSVHAAAQNPDNSKGKDRIIDELVAADMYHESTMLSHVSRRSSKAQGVALLTLFSRGLIPPPAHDDLDPERRSDSAIGVKELLAKDVVDGYKRLIRAGKAMGHLAICWGIITAALGLTLGTSFSLVQPSTLIRTHTLQIAPSICTSFCMLVPSSLRQSD